MRNLIAILLLLIPVQALGATLTHGLGTVTDESICTWESTGDQIDCDIVIGTDVAPVASPTFTGGVTIADSGLIIEDGAGNDSTYTYDAYGIGIRSHAERSVNIGYNANPSGTATNNVVLGPLAGTALGLSQRNVLIGGYAGNDLVDGNGNNVFVGYQAGAQNSSGNANVIIGSEAGSGAGATYSQAVMIGQLAGTALTTGTANLFIGAYAGQSVTEGSNNIMLLGGNSVNTGGQNISLGKESLWKVTSTSGSIALGFRAAQYQTGKENIVLGVYAGRGVNGSSTGEGHVIIGDGAGYGLTTGTRNVLIGRDAAVDFTTESDYLVIDNRDQGTAAAVLTDALIVGKFNATPANQTLLVNGKLVSNTYNFAADAEASDTYVITLDPVPNAYMTGMMITFTANTANTGACTVNVNGLGAKPLKMLHDQDPTDNYIESGSVVLAVYDGTNFQMIQPAAN